MDSEFNRKFIDTIRQKIKGKEQLVPFLMDHLDLGRESTYRRVRNQISFTFDEVAVISKELGISIDELLTDDKESTRTFLKSPSYSVGSSYVTGFSAANELLARLRKSGRYSYLTLTNRLPFLFYARSKNLSKFRIFHWTHMRQDVPLNFKFNEFDYTSEFQSVHANFHYHTSRFDSLTIIVDPNIMLSMMKDIIYFYKRGLVTKDEVLLLQEELYEVIEKMEILTQRGHNEESTECTLYVSYTIVDTNSVIINSEEDGWAFIDPYFFDAMYINNKYVVDQMRDRVLRTKKYSSNITLNNELQQHQFIELLRRQLDSIFEDSILVDI